METNFQNVATAVFEVPVKVDIKSTKGVLMDPVKIKRRSVFCSDDPTANKQKIVMLMKDSLDMITLCMKFSPGDDTWKLVFSNLPPLINTFIKGTAYIRSQAFGAWEPLEITKYFVFRCHFISKFEINFPIDQLERTLSGFRDNGKCDKFTLELKLNIELLYEYGEEECLVSCSKAKLSNELFVPRDKSDFCIKVGYEEFFVHLKQIRAFSFVSKILLNYCDQRECDWSDVLTPDAMRALLRFIYYNEVDKIDSPQVAFHLFRFCHMYIIEDLLKICRMRLVKFPKHRFSLADAFEIYTFVRIPDEFEDLKEHFCRILATIAKNYERTELLVLAQGCKNGVGLEVLIEILYYKDE